MVMNRACILFLVVFGWLGEHFDPLEVPVTFTRYISMP